MQENVTIHNFGPIKEAQIELRDLTVFVGPLASGKSLAAQVLYFLRGIEELMPPDTEDPVATTLAALELWLGYDPSLLITESTTLTWQNQKMQWLGNSMSLNQTLEQRIRTWWKSGTSPLKQIYIPAGRILYSFVPPFAAPQLQLLFSRSRAKSQALPGYISTFYAVLGSVLEALWHDQEVRKHGQKSFSDTLDEIQSFRTKARAITKGDLHYGPGTISLEIGKKIFQSSAISAGQMEIWPFLAITESILSFSTSPFKYMYFEEPEAHLHPGAQRQVMEIVAQLVRQNVKCVITTHSPYILYVINNFLMTQKVLDKERSLPCQALEATALAQHQVAAYRFSPDGYVSDIMDSETGLIDEEELDRVADDLGSTFSDLQDALED
ncbi:MAG: hypothetical protein EI684_10530 [Candidatus Viridilinea halotolerans]|uniref:Endonuclease GajA/Old nuclease/RecF-like AAA domain-containing protein n=1 Tax=Candidatus Viridilinea halotolerans TaxID=2491704 RepID=A0A426U037_9CHLR|nr:MAG: hypothetical protein EI684_10530 [Candidatus Viridilinea halotolerans]